MNIEKVKDALVLSRDYINDGSLLPQDMNHPYFKTSEAIDAALAELEKPGEALEAVERWADEYYGHSVLVGDVHRSLAVAFTAFAASYHAKKCAECVKRDTPIGCRSCADYPCALSSDSNATCCDGKFWNLKEPPHAL